MRTVTSKVNKKRIYRERETEEREREKEYSEQKQKYRDKYIEKDKHK
jgi:hypothetical protein